MLRTDNPAADYARHCRAVLEPAEARDARIDAVAALLVAALDGLPRPLAVDDHVQAIAEAVVDAQIAEARA